MLTNTGMDYSVVKGDHSRLRADGALLNAGSDFIKVCDCRAQGYASNPTALRYFCLSDSINSGTKGSSSSMRLLGRPDRQLGQRVFQPGGRIHRPQSLKTVMFRDIIGLSEMAIRCAKMPYLTKSCTRNEYASDEYLSKVFARRAHLKTSSNFEYWKSQLENKVCILIIVILASDAVRR